MGEWTNEVTDQEIQQLTIAIVVMSLLAIAQEPARMMDHGQDLLPLVLELPAQISQTQLMDK